MGKTVAVMFQRLFSLIIILLFGTLLVLDFGHFTVWCDNCLVSRAMHFSGGIAVGLLAIYAIWYWPSFQTIQDSGRVAITLFITGTVVLAAVFWEFYEFVLDTKFPWFKGALSQPSLRDTMADLFFGFLGGLVCVFIYWILKRYKESFFSK